MAYTIYENEIFKNTVASMIRKDRIVSSFLIIGEKGLGKKTASDYIAAAILCEQKSGEPCGKCKSCRMIHHKTHPDVIYAVADGKSGNYKVDNIRKNIIDTSVLAPNEGRYKIYIIPDMDATLAASQNALLKIIEEPPDHCVFILTASARSSLLPTIVSRVTALSLHEVKKSSCLNALEALGFSKEQAAEAFGVMGGNIGKCADYLNNGRLKDAVYTSTAILEAMNAGDEYMMLKEICELSGDKEMTLDVLKLLCETVRDAVAIRAGCGEQTLISSNKKGAFAFAKKTSIGSLQRIYKTLTKHIDRLNKNANLNLSLNAMCSELKEIL